MNIDELISHLQAVRDKQGGSHKVMLGHAMPGFPNTWSGVPLEPSMVRESIFESSFKNVPGFSAKTGWLWFEVPEGGIKHRQRKR